MSEIQLSNLIIAVLIGVIMYSGGFILLKYPPKDINSWYGYRTPRSMKNATLWNEGNLYSAKLMKQYGIIYVIVGCLLSLLFTQVWVMILIVGLMMVMFIRLFMKVENRLKELELEEK